MPEFDDRGDIERDREAPVATPEPTFRLWVTQSRDGLDRTLFLKKDDAIDDWDDVSRFHNGYWLSPEERDVPRSDIRIVTLENGDTTAHVKFKRDESGSIVDVIFDFRTCPSHFLESSTYAGLLPLLRFMLG